jgi:hypothetical protein
MASSEAKVKRRALALNELQRLSDLLADNLEIEMPDLRAKHRDPQLEEIQRIEAVNQLLTGVLTGYGVDTEPKTEPSEDIEHMTKAQLLELAASKNVEVSKSATKAEIKEALSVESK